MGPSSYRRDTRGAAHPRLRRGANGWHARRDSITETQVEDWDYTSGVLLRGVFLGMKHGARILKAQGDGGTIVSTASVAAFAAVGTPDPVRTEVVKAFVVLQPGFEAGPALARDIQQHVKTRLAAHEYPREVEFLDSLPLTATGKIMRRELRLQALRPSGA